VELVERPPRSREGLKREAPLSGALLVGPVGGPVQAGQGFELSTCRKLFVRSRIAGFGFG
jgi:hypothetical protein